MVRFILCLTIAPTMLSCRNSQHKDVEKAALAINEKDFARNLTVISSDAYQGRKPMTKGEDSTVRYIKTQLQKLKLEPAFGKSYYQDVPLVNIISASSGMTFKTKKGLFALKSVDDFVAFTEQIIEKSDLENGGH